MLNLVPDGADGLHVVCTSEDCLSQDGSHVIVAPWPTDNTALREMVDHIKMHQEQK